MIKDMIRKKKPKQLFQAKIDDDLAKQLRKALKKDKVQITQFVEAAAKEYLRQKDESINNAIEDALNDYINKKKLEITS